ncbi:hypothetical protein [Spongorhabdus nitratireducens]
MKNLLLTAAVFSATLNAAEVTVLDKTHYPAGQFLAYTEFELSGEPLVEGLGLDLDVLDPNRANQPTAFDFMAGIGSYEYSEEAMYALNYQSTMGPHLVNGPLNKARGGKMEDLGKRLLEMAKAVGFPAGEIPLNMFPISLPYVSGSPEFLNKPDMTVVNTDEVEIVTAKGVEKKVQTVTPAYFRDYKTLAWDPATFDKSFSPATTGGILLKEVMWAQDFLGGMHVTATDEEVEAKSSKMNHDGKHSLGVSAADGFNGMILTELSLDKLLIMQDQMGFDGKTLGVKFGPDYDPAKQKIWFPAKVKVQEGKANGVNAIEELTVTDPASTLRDTWLMLWPVSELFAFSDQRTRNTAQNPAFLAVFDGAPFAAAPAVNTDDKTTNDVVGTDMFSVTSNMSHILFENLVALHFNSKAGTFVTRFADNNQGNDVDTYDASYVLVALSIFERSQDALPVGYAAAGDSAVNLATPQGKQALELITRQADFILNNLIGPNGLAFDSMELEGKIDKTQSLGTQFAVLRGLSTAFLATKNPKYRAEARKLYLAVEKQMYDEKLGTWATTPGQPTLYTPYTVAAVSGGLRDTIQQLRNQEGENDKALELQNLADRYVAWFRTVINGGMQLAEWLGDSGENRIKGSDSGDTDEDRVPQITAAGGKYGTAPVMAEKARVSVN